MHEPFRVESSNSFNFFSSSPVGGGRRESERLREEKGGGSGSMRKIEAAFAPLPIGEKGGGGGER
jgi:hypothetical protein